MASGPKPSKTTAQFRAALVQMDSEVKLRGEFFVMNGLCICTCVW